MNAVELHDRTEANITATCQSIKKRLGAHIRGIREGDLVSALSDELYAHEARNLKLHSHRWAIAMTGLSGLAVGLLIGTLL